MLQTTNQAWASACDAGPFMEWPGGFPLPHPDELQRRLVRLIDTAFTSPCAKSKRAAMFISNNAFGIATNAPADGALCRADDFCRSHCAEICNHAEVRAILQALLKPRYLWDQPLLRIHVVHMAVDEQGRPRSKPIPSCLTCSNTMTEVGVEAVWLWGVQAEGEEPRWRGWPMALFHKTTLENCGLLRKEDQ